MLPTRLLEGVARLGRPGRVLAARADLIGSAGPGYFLRRLRDQRRFAGFGEDARNAVYERIWRDAAEAVGAAAEIVSPGTLVLSRDGVATRVCQRATELDDPAVLHLALDKPAVHRRLTEAGVTVPDHVEFAYGDPASALDFLEDGPCVLKPAAGTGGGHGTTAGIATADELRRACVHAARVTDRLLIERQAPGAVYRLLLLDGELLDVVRSEPARLVGDGRQTIAKLIRAENERRVAAAGELGLSRLGIDLDLILALERQDLSLSSVPAAGQAVSIRAITNDAGAERSETWSGTPAEELVDEARAAVEAIGLRLAGADAITPDPTRPLAETGGAINEVNGNPGLHHHYLVAEPARATPVAVPVLERLLGS